MNNTNITQTTMEGSLISAIEDSYEKLDSIRPYSTQIDDFLVNIKLSADVPYEMDLIRDSFVISCDNYPFDKVTLTPLIVRLRILHPDVSRNQIRFILMRNFKSWLINYHPDLRKIYPSISFVHLLRIFAKKFS